MTNRTAGGIDRLPVASGRSLAVQRVGSGPPVLFIPGSGGDHTAWGAQVRHLRESFTCYVLDLPGVGHSDPVDGDLDVATITDDCLRVMDHYDLPPVPVVGLSLGSAVAQQLALAAPDRVAALALFATWGHQDGYLAVKAELIRDLVHSLRDRPRVYGRYLLWFLASPRFLSDEERIEATVGGMFAGTRSPDPDRLLQHLSAGRPHDLLPRLAAVTQPVLVASGEQDIMTPPRYGREVADALPNARFHLVTGAGSSHLMHVERRAEVNDLLSRFLRDPGGAVTGS